MRREKFKMSAADMLSALASWCAQDDEWPGSAGLPPGDMWPLRAEWPPVPVGDMDDDHHALRTEAERMLGSWVTYSTPWAEVYADAEACVRNMASQLEANDLPAWAVYATPESMGQLRRDLLRQRKGRFMFGSAMRQGDGPK